MLAGAGLRPVVEILSPRDVREGLRRIPIVASGKTTADIPSSITNHRGIPRGLISCIFTQLVQFFLGWQIPVGFAVVAVLSSNVNCPRGALAVGLGRV